jgi:hypothetical protein
VDIESAHDHFERELAADDRYGDARYGDLRSGLADPDAPDFDDEPDPGDGYRSRPGPRPAGRADHRTQGLVSHGRSGASSARLRLRLRLQHQLGRLTRQHKIALGAAVVAGLVTFLVISLTGSSGSWPASVATVQAQADRACQNPDVKSEPGQVDFACAKSSRSILWVFSLMTSGDDPGFVDKATGRRGLEPITPSQGGEVAWSLNLHRPYQPANPIDSLEVAARAVNDIIGGATVTGTSGKPQVQAGLEGKPSNCLRYTGSGALRSRDGYPSLCAQPLTPSGEAALVEDVFSKWIVGASPSQAYDAAVLFTHADDPGNPQVQLVLRHLAKDRSTA